MRIGAAIGRVLAELGVRQVFGVVGSGNFHVTNALVDAGVAYVAARHECGAATMADAYGRLTGSVAAVTVHQGCGLTNAMTGIAEAAKSRTPMLVLAAEADDPRSNFAVDQPALATAVGAVSMRVTSAVDAVATAVAAYRTAVDDRRTVLLNLPLAAQAEELTAGWTLPDAPTPTVVAPSADDVDRLTDLLATSKRPVFVAGRGARSPAARDAVRALAERTGALLATSAAAKGLFRDDPWSLDVSGGFAAPLAAELIRGADLIIGWGCALNMWTMRHGELIGAGATVVQVDIEADALGRHRAVDFGAIGDVAATASALSEAMSTAAPGTRYRTDDIRRRISVELRWRDVPFDDASTVDRIDPRTVSIALDDLLPAERTLCIDSGNFMGYPSMFMSVPDELGFCFTQAFQSIGLGLASAIGAAIAQPNRLTVAALGDGGAAMSIAELDTVARLGLDMIIVVYNDDAYGAEVHHFGPDGHDLDTVRFPATDFASIARGFGLAGLTARRRDDLAAVAAWVTGDRSRPLLVDAKIVDDGGSWWLKDAFRGHLTELGRMGIDRTRSVGSMTAPHRSSRRVPRWSAFAPLISLDKPDLSPTRRRLAKAVTIDDLRSIARRRSPRSVFDYADGAASAEISLARARRLFADLQFNPSVLRDVSQVDTSTSILGTRSEWPFAFAPTGLTRLMHHEGERAVARVAERYGVPFALSTMGTTSIEDVAVAAPNARKWFQLYVWRDRAAAEDLVARAQAAGYEALVLTVDVPVGGPRLRDDRNGFSIPPKLKAKTVGNAILHPAWWLNLLTTDPLTFASLSSWDATVKEMIDTLFDPTMTVGDLAWLRSAWDGPLVIKGIQTVDDARRVVDAGADAVVVSNHGGRQLDRAPIPLRLLPDVVQELQGRAEVWLDTGIMNGADIVAARALGADAVLVGRAYLYGLMAGGERGVERAAQILTTEVRRTMQLLGVQKIAELGPQHVTLP